MYAAPARIVRSLCAAALIGLLHSAAAAPRPAGPAQAQLEALRSKIGALTQARAAQLKERNAGGARLREAELRITALRARLESLRVAQAAGEQHRAALRGAYQRSESQLRAERGVLAAQVRAAYVAGGEAPLKALLNPSAPARLGRNAIYYQYFAQARRVRIEQVQATLAALAALVAQIDAAGENLRDLSAQAARELADLQQARGERAQTLAALDAELAHSGAQLGGMKHDEQALESLLADLSRAVPEVPTDPGLGFAHMRGKLPWPLAGHVSEHYGQARGAGVRSSGIVIDGARGEKIRATYFGRVVYADWLQGLGLLLIVAHSDGYLTLYGHAEVLYKAVGDRVQPGEAIAALSESAPPRPQLYFEIRAGRSTLDPQSWLQRAAR